MSEKEAFFIVWFGALGLMAAWMLGLALLDRIDTWRMRRAEDQHTLNKLAPLSNGRKPR